MVDVPDSSRTSPEERLLSLRDAWVEAENARTVAYKDFMDANKASPLRKELDEAEKAAKRAESAYASALQKQ